MVTGEDGHLSCHLLQGTATVTFLLLFQALGVRVGGLRDVRYWESDGEVPGCLPGRVEPLWEQARPRALASCPGSKSSVVPALASLALCPLWSRGLGGPCHTLPTSGLSWKERGPGAAQGSSRAQCRRASWVFPGSKAMTLWSSGMENATSVPGHRPQPEGLSAPLHLTTPPAAGAGLSFRTSRWDRDGWTSSQHRPPVEPSSGPG